ncbi:hypothetical protein Mbo2_117 [Rhodococcus phage Mbo2]|uniref:Uncharacterized protein n=1 Tax=Rhodococcus phage Mbo2 TaxID=2936911 RepID=A0A9E7L9Z0_9CAUD|nr:hypothetical protein Mbo2_117 [Rhodococcus phage Mbo2]
MKRSDITDEQVIAACRIAHSDNHTTSLIQLISMTGAIQKVALAAMERASDRGLIDYGVNIAHAWVVADT